MSKRFVSCLNCIDGRTQRPLMHWLEKNCGDVYPDLMTAPGMDGLLAKGEEPEGVLKSLAMSVQRGSREIFIIGHTDCLGNPVDDEAHQRDIHAAVARVRDLYPDGSVKGLWVTAQGEVETVT